MNHLYLYMIAVNLSIYFIYLLTIMWPWFGGVFDATRKVVAPIVRRPLLQVVSHPVFNVSDDRCAACWYFGI